MFMLLMRKDGSLKFPFDKSWASKLFLWQWQPAILVFIFLHSCSLFWGKSHGYMMLNLFLKGVLTFLSIMTFGPYAADKQTARLFSVNYLCAYHRYRFAWVHRSCHQIYVGNLGFSLSDQLKFWVEVQLKQSPQKKVLR